MKIAKMTECRACGGPLIGYKCRPCLNAKERSRYADMIRKTQGRDVAVGGITKAVTELILYTHKTTNQLSREHEAWIKENGIKIKIKLKKFDLNVFEDNDNSNL